MKTTRSLRILYIFIKYDLGRFLTFIHIRKKLLWLPLYLLLAFLIGLGHLFGKRIPKEVALRMALEELGPIFIKFGQIISTRIDLLSPEMAEELTRLQDRVTPHNSEEIKQVIRRSLGGNIETFFTEFNDTCAASASVAQVHFATLKKEKVSVAIKVIKPNIRPTIQQDLALLYFFASVIGIFFQQAYRLRLKEAIGEFEHTLEAELDMQQEGANACQLKRNFKNPGLLDVPKIYWDYTSQEVLTMERINCITISDKAELERKKVNLRVLAEKGVNIFYTQVLRDSFFHADMHPGNIFVDASDPQDPIYRGVDFGIMGSLSPADRKYLALNFLAFFNRDYKRVAELHIRCGWVSRNTRVERLEASIRGVCEPIFSKSLNEISFGKVLSQLLRIAQKFNMEVQPQLLLLQKTLINVEGLGRQLYPELNVWETAKPHLVKWLKNETSVRQLVKNARRGYPELLVRLPDLAADAIMILEENNRFLKQGKHNAVKNNKTLFWIIVLTLIAALSCAGGLLIGLSL